jgi:phosphoribosylamine---glycine ligase
LAQSWAADLVVIGPEAPLVAGVADVLRDRGIPCFGPGAQAAQLEGSKAFAKEIMAAAGVPTGLARVCATEEEVRAALAAFGAPHVVKDDGLAAGKGVVVTEDPAVALEHARLCLGRGGPARVVVEEYLDGPEVSLFCLSDGTAVVPLAPAQDFKRLGDGDTGPNTGGMGAYCPLPWADPNLVADVLQRVAQPTIDELRHRGIPFVGLLYIGLAITKTGPKVIEFNARFGDPETQVVLARLRSSLGSLLHAAATGSLAEQPSLRWSEQAAVTVVMAAKGYPEAPQTGAEITGLTTITDPNIQVLHAGTSAADGVLRVSGGRVLSVVGTGSDLAAATAAAYAGVAQINLPGGQFRSDIAAAASAV